VPTPQDILGAKGGGDSNPIKEYVGQTFTVSDFSYANGRNGRFVVMTAVNDDGEEFKVRTGAEAVVSKLEQLRDAGALPIEVLVTSFQTKHGTTGYDLDNPDA